MLSSNAVNTDTGSPKAKMFLIAVDLYCHHHKISIPAVTHSLFIPPYLNSLPITSYMNMDYTFLDFTIYKLFHLKNEN